MSNLRLLITMLAVLPMQGYVSVSFAHETERLDYHACRTLVEKGDILPMAELHQRVDRLTEGRMLDTTLLRHGSGYIYEMEVAGRDGVVRIIYVDARTGSLLTE
ncbi:PepSY domain-containing protein [Marinobacterium arenosum]|uniref:PepSY domain-containing protein n=1 Tax=Marinobacterium arenosum TaxID=2862496 RepID=UPI001C93DEA7|nr:hypothetical protein [Marinobacterium arenosum]MBY4675541.1 hypothetical protein [Marinobacterium arenosum]